MTLFSSLCLLAVASGATVAAQNLSDTSYAPVHVQCPSDVTWFRPANGLSPQETAWLAGKKPVVAAALNEYLTNVDLKDFNVAKYIKLIEKNNYAATPVLSFALSGGGFASAFTGFGGLRAMDSRTPAAVTQKTGGLLQSLTYIAGQSGGSWPVVSLAEYNFPSIDQLTQLWQPDIDRLSGTGPTTAYAANSSTIFQQIAAKYEAGFLISVADYFGRAYSYEFLPGINGGLGVTFSGIQNASNFINHQMPFPLVPLLKLDASDPVEDGVQLPLPTDTLFEMSVFEFGSWNHSAGSANGFTPTEYLGTSMSGGKPVNASSCVKGFDSASFVMGSVADGFNFWYLEEVSNFTLGAFSKRSEENAERELEKRTTYHVPAAGILPLAAGFNSTFGIPISESPYSWYPNPFKNEAGSEPAIQNLTALKLVDATENGQAIPYWTLIQQPRNASFIISWDDNLSSNPYNWNNGSEIYQTYIAANNAGLPFPTIPDTVTFQNYGFGERPTFFGCDIKLTTTGTTESPIVLYIPNAPYSAFTNYSYAQSSFDANQFSEIMVNSFNIMTAGNGTLDKKWPQCLACAAIDRSLTKIGMNRTAQCTKCFNQYCWNGTTDDSDPGVFDPKLALDPSESFLEWNATHEFP